MTIEEKIKRFCIYQERSVAEVRTKLLSLCVNKDETEKYISQLLESNYVDDKRFTLQFIQGKMNTKGWGKYKIKMHLLQKGINETLIQESLAEINSENFQANSNRIIEKWKECNSLNKNTFPRFYRYLLSKGYTYNEVSKALQSIDPC